MKQSNSGMMRAIAIAAAWAGGMVPTVATGAGQIREPRDMHSRNGKKQAGVAAAKRAKQRRINIRLHGG